MEECTCFETARENRDSFLSIAQMCEFDAELFLRRDEYISMRSTKSCHLTQSIGFDFIIDNDGIVVELSSIEGIRLPIHHLTFMPSEIYDVKNVFPMLKKHLNLTNYSRNNLSLLRKSVGFQISYELGWNTFIAMVPTGTGNCTDIDGGALKSLSFSLFVKLRNSFSSKLQKLVENGSELKSLHKNCLTNLKKFRVMEDDRHKILTILKDSIDEVHALSGFRFLIFSFQFGQRSEKNVDLTCFDKNVISKITVHVAVNISSVYNIHFMWSKIGIGAIIGHRGTMFSCMSFFEACNWQSNLDGRHMDISSDLRNVCIHPSCLQFIQLYCDSPHLRYDGVCNPVSGSIVAGGLANGKSQSSIYNCAENYISTMRNNFQLLQKLKCRLEIVASLPSVPDFFSGSAMLSVTQVKELLASYPLLIPVADDHRVVRNTLCNLGLHLTSVLHEHYSTHKGTSSFEGTWKCVQAELAIEKMLYGRPLSIYTHQTAVNLGPGISEPSRSRTDYLGFLSLEHYAASASDENCPPPTKIWFSDLKLQEKVTRLFGFYDFLDASDSVLGRRAILILFGDLIDSQSRSMSMSTLLTNLKASNPFCSVVGGATSTVLANLIMSPQRGNTPFSRALDMIRKLRASSARDILNAGILDLELTYFPSIKLYDANRHRALCWSGQHLHFVRREGEQASMEEQSSALSDNVLVELERNELVFASKLSQIRDKRLPWVLPILKKLRGHSLQEDQLLTLLTFLSAISLIQCGWYVNFQALCRLESRIPISQFQLRAMEIQSKYTLPSVNITRIWRLHHSLPIKLQKTEKMAVNDEANGVITERRIPQVHELNILPEVEETSCCETVVKGCSRHRPAGYTKLWTAEEIEILWEIHDMVSSSILPSAMRYQKYIELCRKRGILDRTKRSFSNKYNRTFQG